MDPNDLTPEALERALSRARESIATVAKRKPGPLTLVEKLLYGHLEDPASQDLSREATLRLRPDRVVLQDVLGQTAFLQLPQTGRDRVALPTTVHCDHLVRARDGAAADLSRAIDDNDEVFDFLRSAAAHYGAGFYAPGAGIIHQVVLEQYAAPGQLVLGTDSHTPNASGLGGMGVGVGGAEAVEAMAGLGWEVGNPRRIAVVLTGALCGWSAPKDVILWVAGQLGVQGGTGAVIEYLGPGARSLRATGKATIANMGAEVGATSSVFPTDEAILAYLAATGREALVPVVRRYLDVLGPDMEAESAPEQFYDRVLRLNLSSLEPQVAGPHTPDRLRPLSQLVREKPAPLGAALLGSCTNSSFEDLSRAASVAASALSLGLRAQVPFYVSPGSERVRRLAEEAGLLAKLEGIGARILANACGPCIGQWDRQGGQDGDAIVTSFNRNFPGRNDGKAATQAFLASPELVVAFAVAGRLDCDPRELLPVPEEAVAAPSAPKVRAFYEPPVPGTAVRIRPGSERLSALSPWPAWDGGDLVGLPILFRARGKTTTDAISPAGAWLKYRGNLDRFSDNLLSGGIDAWTGERGRTRDVESGERAPVAVVARRYQARGIRWVIVGDANYGEGSSREHAALSPRHLGGIAVIARSFARIHETNLKKQGLLALRFRDPEDYERLRVDDRLDLVGLSALAPGRPVECRVRHADGTGFTAWLEHSCTAAQIGWFRAGSSLRAAA